MRAKGEKRKAKDAAAIAGVALTLASLFNTGCSTFNFSPLHSALSETRLQERVDKRFPIGTPRAEVAERLDRMGIHHYETPVPLRNRPGEDSMGATLDAPWRYLQLLTRRMAFVRFTFDPESNLEGTHIEYGMIGL